MTLSIFSYVSGSSACPLWRSVYSGPLPIFNWIVCLHGVELHKSLCILEIKPFFQCIACKYVLPYGGFSFHVDDGFFTRVEAF